MPIQLPLTSQIDLPVQRVFQAVQGHLNRIDGSVSDQASQIKQTLTSDSTSLLSISSFVRQQLQSNGQYPLPLSGLPGSTNITVNGVAAANTTPTQNLNNTTPAPASGGTNVLWQADSKNPRNVSAYLPAASSGGGGTITLAGDLGGTASLPKVVGLQGVPIIVTAPSDQQVLQYVAAAGKWEPQTVFPVSIANGGTGAITAGAALTNLGGASLTANNTFVGIQTYSATCNFGAQALNFATVNVTWNEWRITAVNVGSVVANDTLQLQWNSRTSSGGTDAWAAIFQVATGASGVFPAITFVAGVSFANTVSFSQPIVVSAAATFSSTVALNGAVTLGAGLNLNGQTVSGNATLSGALTFSNAANIVFGSNWQNYTPTVNGGTMTVSSLVVNDAQYLQIGPIVYVKLQLTFTLGGTASTLLKISYPIAPVGFASLLTGMIAMGGTSSFVSALSNIYLVNGYIGFQLFGAANFTLGGASLYLVGSYRCA